VNVLFLTTNAEIEASTRYRVLQYVPALRAAGHQVTFSPFYPQARGPRVPRMARGFAARAYDLARAAQFDVVLVHRELLPFGWNHLAPLFAARVPFVFDFDDAIHIPSLGGWRARVATPRATRILVERAARVFAGNAYLAEWAREANERVDIVPTVVDTDVYRPRERPPRDMPLIGWVGSPTTAKYLSLIVPVLEELAKSFRFRVRIVGAGTPVRIDGVEVESPPWRANGEHELFDDLDIGVYPLTDDPWARGKCGFKAIQYLACGVASVSSPVGVVREIVRDGTDGLLATTPREWKDRLALLLGSADERSRFAGSARARAVERYSLRAATPLFVGGLLRAAGTA
jgi:glycosyltransferase involved in cell wall biosynthesis